MLPSEVNHYEMLCKFIEGQVDVQSQEQIEMALTLAVAYRDEGLISQGEIELIAELIRAIK